MELVGPLMAAAAAIAGGVVAQVTRARLEDGRSRRIVRQRAYYLLETVIVFCNGMDEVPDTNPIPPGMYDELRATCQSFDRVADNLLMLGATLLDWRLIGLADSVRLKTTRMVEVERESESLAGDDAALERGDARRRLKSLREEASKLRNECVAAWGPAMETSPNGSTVNWKRGALRASLVLWAGWATWLGFATYAKWSSDVTGFNGASLHGAASDTTAVLAPPPDPPESALELLDPGATELGHEVKREYPGAYDDMADVVLGSRMEEKHPGVIARFKRRRAVRDSVEHVHAMAQLSRATWAAWLDWFGAGVLAPVALLALALWILRGFSTPTRDPARSADSGPSATK